MTYNHCDMMIYGLQEHLEWQVGELTKAFNDSKWRLVRGVGLIEMTMIGKFMRVEEGG